MAKKTANTKVEAAKGRKAVSKAEKDQQKKAEVEAKEDAKWAKGAKKSDKKELEAEKKAALLLKKQEAQRILVSFRNCFYSLYKKKLKYNFIYIG